MNYLVSFSPDWFVHQVVSALIHSAVYGVMYHVFKGLSLPAAILAGVAALVVAWFVIKLFSK